MTLYNLDPGQSAYICSIDADEGLYQRMLALGFRIGKRVEMIRRARFSGPVHVRIGTTDVMMRLTEAQRVHIRNIS
ncbi:MAG: ferrous iron transport protein A [Methylophilaceae bacterium]|nr:ferrous iron transport protein A [Methylophilaceae bacterium]